MNIVDWTLVAQISVVVTAATQIIKTKRPFNQMDGEVLAVFVGIMTALYFCLLNPATAGGDWHYWMRCATSGLVAGVAASGLYNVQKALPTPNVLPTRSEKVPPTS